MSVEYIYPYFTSFYIQSQPTTVEVGTTLSGPKTFIWSIASNSGSVSTIDLYDDTVGSTLLSNTPNDGTQAQTITSIQLNSNGSTQTWHGIGHDANSTGTPNFNSSSFSVVSRFILFYGPVAAHVVDSTTARALPSSQYYLGGGAVTLNTGITYSKFDIVLPLGSVVTNVLDTDVNATITDQYINQGSIIIVDAGGTNRTYTLFTMTQAIPYTSNHHHVITFS